MSIGSGEEWLPTLGVSWQVVQWPLIVAMPSLSLRPATPVIAIGLVLNTTAPRTMAARLRLRLLGPGAVERHHRRVERVAEDVAAEYVVDRDVEVDQRDVAGAAEGAAGVENPCAAVKLLGRGKVQLEVDDLLEDRVGGRLGAWA